MLRENILEILKKWNESSLNELDVHSFAENLVENMEMNDEDTIASEVLLQLDIMNHQLITKTDIPVIVEFLETQKGKEIEAWKKWKNYWETVDFEKRKTQLKNNPFYCI